MKFNPKKEQRMLTYQEKGIPKYVVTQVIANGSYRLYKCNGEELVYMKTRKNDPLFKEIKPVKR